MFRRTTQLAGVTALICLVAIGSGFSTELEVGTAAPDWSGIVGTDDKEHALADYQDAKAVVLVFTCNHCPVAKAYEDRLIALQADYQDKGVQVIAVNCNKGAGDRLEPMKQRAAEKEFNFPYLFDESQQTGHDYGARVTPHPYLLDGDRKIVYVGAIDDNMNAEKATEHYLRDALDALLAGKDVPEIQKKAFGCGIKYEKK